MTDSICGATRVTLTGMTIHETAEYLGTTSASLKVNGFTAQQKSKVDQLIVEMQTRISDALDLKDAGAGGDFLSAIGRWTWPFPSVEKKFYEELFSKI